MTTVTTETSMTADEARNATIEALVREVDYLLPNDYPAWLELARRAVTTERKIESIEARVTAALTELVDAGYGHGV
jgi:hypothetical protein